MTLDELRDRILNDQITRSEVMDALRETLERADASCDHSRLSQAITWANIYYSARKWGQHSAHERAKARLLADLTKVVKVAA
jgi:hypothetical protein